MIIFRFLSVLVLFVLAGGSITLWGGSGNAFGFTYSPQIPLLYRGGPETVSISVGRYEQIWPLEYPL